MASLPPRIDVHSHFLPPFYRDALAKTGHSNPDGMPAIPPWSEEAHLELMRKANITRSILSISSPGTNLYPDNPAATIELTRRCNAYAADLKKRNPEKFGFWASLPLPNVDAALAEIDKAVDEGCDGFTFKTNYQGVYIGDALFDPIFKKLDDMGAIVFIHPTCPCVSSGIVGGSTVGKGTDVLPFGSRYPVPIFEFLFDTARAVINLFYTGTIARGSNIQYIIPHAGGTLPPLITRFTLFGTLIPGAAALDGPEVRKQMQEQFFFDLAGATFDGKEGGRGQLKALIEGWDIDHSRLMYGSDFPFTPENAALMLAERMKDGLECLYDEDKRAAVYEGNAVRLLEQGGKRRERL